MLQSRGNCEEPASKIDAVKYSALIRQLVSPNQPPKTQNDGEASVLFPKDYDVQAQKRIDVARLTLRDEMPKSLPYLVDALEDKRYCLTIDWAEGDGYYNESVGDVCRNVIASQLEIYREKIAFSDSGHWHHYGYPVSKKWFATRIDKSLVDLQIEAIDFATSKRKSDPVERFQGSRKNEIVGLEELRDELAKSRQPAKPRRLLRMVTSDRP